MSAAPRREMPPSDLEQIIPIEKEPQAKEAGHLKVVEKKPEAESQAKEPITAAALLADKNIPAKRRASAEKAFSGGDPFARTPLGLGEEKIIEAQLEGQFRKGKIAIEGKNWQKQVEQARKVGEEAIEAEKKAEAEAKKESLAKAKERLKLQPKEISDTLQPKARIHAAPETGRHGGYEMAQRLSETSRKKEVEIYKLVNELTRWRDAINGTSTGIDTGYFIKANTFEVIEKPGFRNFFRRRKFKNEIADIEKLTNRLHLLRKDVETIESDLKRRSLDLTEPTKKPKAISNSGIREAYGEVAAEQVARAPELRNVTPATEQGKDTSFNFDKEKTKMTSTADLDAEMARYKKLFPLFEKYFPGKVTRSKQNHKVFVFTHQNGRIQKFPEFSQMVKNSLSSKTDLAMSAEDVGEALKYWLSYKAEDLKLDENEKQTTDKKWVTRTQKPPEELKENDYSADEEPLKKPSYTAKEMAEGLSSQVGLDERIAKQEAATRAEAISNLRIKTKQESPGDEIEKSKWEQKEAQFESIIKLSLDETDPDRLDRVPIEELQETSDYIAGMLEKVERYDLELPKGKNKIELERAKKIIDEAIEKEKKQTLSIEAKIDILKNIDPKDNDAVDKALSIVSLDGINKKTLERLSFDMLSDLKQNLANIILEQRKLKRPEEKIKELERIHTTVSLFISDIRQAEFDKNAK